MHIFQNEQVNTLTRISTIKSVVEEYKSCWSPTILSKVPRNIELLVSWKKPPLGWIKINVDGARDRSSGTIGAGGIARDHNGAWIAGFVYNIGKGGALLAEAWAARTGAQLALDKGYSNVILESDSLDLVNMLNQTENQPLEAPLINLREDIQKILSKVATKEIVHCYREGNLPADVLAKMALSNQNGIMMLQSPPLALANLIYQDMNGVSVARDVNSSEIG